MQAAAVAPETPVRPEHELKFVLPDAAAGIVFDWLRARCLPDPAYPDGIVSSIYFDGRNLRFLDAKINSDFEKTKVRLRWYGDPQTGAPQSAAFLEVKRKIGARRFKSRQPLEVPITDLSRVPLSSSMFHDVLSMARNQGIHLPSDLLAVMEVRFRRRRFIEPTSGSRVSIDSDIRAVRTNATVLPGINPFPLVHAVLESKGERRQLPALLRPLTTMGCHKESFSKYARCYQKVMRRTSL